MKSVPLPFSYEEGLCSVFASATPRLLPLTRALALMRYGLLDHNGSGLHDILGYEQNTSLMAALSLAVVAAALTAVSILVFRRAAVR